MAKMKQRYLNKIKSKKYQWVIAITAVLTYIILYIPVPYFIAAPGQAIELDTIIEVEDGTKESGELMLTSVSMYGASVLTVIYSKFNSYMELIPKELILDEDEGQDDYSKRQLQVMDESQEEAIIAAYSYLDLPIDIKNNGVLVMGILPNTPSEDVLEIGDLIISVDDRKITNLEDMLSYFNYKNEHEIVKINYIREKKEYTDEIPLVNLNSGNKQDTGKNRVGLGIYPFEDRVVSTSKVIEFKTNDIGGPSAGLMFTLEIINQISEEDLTKGYKIAGTGTIDVEGNVGQIGSPRLKVKTAYDKGAEIFFVPEDIEEFDTNELEAKQANKNLKNQMKIVPVSTINEAIEYLKQLPEK